MTTPGTDTTPATPSKRAVVTGASSGIGAATVRALIADGWAVVGVARREDRLAELAAETGCDYVVADITDKDSVTAAITAITALGPIDALVNNAGGALGIDRVDSADLDLWERMYDLNVIGTFRITNALLPALRETAGSIVFITSTAAHEPYEGGGGYVASKYAERVAARTMRLELVGEPLRVIEIAPGMVHTEEFSLVRFGGDKSKADSVYDGVPNPLTAGDIAESIRWSLSMPPHVNIDSLVVRPVAQAAYTKTHRVTQN
ncbi:SDR family oxidoreductase [Jonesia quinghaiensis]|uniref:SDR family oxidoreductase n=1 Tax=Jonesia quinghaiensis TaxID=262806 RepID=UPI0003F4AD9E|nr:SDR family oxidoreductase [Jonesia quinghaiensis]